MHSLKATLKKKLRFKITGEQVDSSLRKQKINPPTVSLWEDFLMNNGGTALALQAS